jgi:nucleotide-binding universal stress UspA family protein
MTRQLIVALDGSNLAEAALPHARSRAEQLDAGLILVRVHTPLPGAADPPLFPGASAWLMSPSLNPEMETSARRWLDERGAKLRANSKVPVTTAFRVGIAAEEIAAVARETSALAIICTTHGSGGWAPEWIGSVCDAIIHRAPCPVLALSKAATERRVGIHSILVPLDGTVGADQALPEAVMLAKALDAKLELVRVVAPAWIGETLLMMPHEGSDPLGIDSLAAEAKATLDTAAADLRREGLDVSAVVAVGANGTRGVLKRIHEANPDLVVVTTGLRGLSRLVLPSLSDRVMRAGGCPTLIVHHGERSHGAWHDLRVLAAETPR